MDRLTAEVIIASIATTDSEGYCGGDNIFRDKLKKGEMGVVEAALLQTIKDLYPDIAERYSYLYH